MTAHVFAHSLVVQTALGLALVLGTPGWVQAQTAIYRCGNEYTNNPGDVKARGCRLVEGTNLTVIEGARPQRNGSASGKPGDAGATPPGAPKVDNAEQRARDADARAILMGELRKAEARLAEARLEYSNGEPEKQGNEFRNHQRYLDRVAELKARLDRAEGDVAAIKRELTRLDAPASR